MATSEQQRKFIAQAIPCAQAAYRKYGKVWPSIAVAMACVECGYGTAGSVKHHSYLGQKVGTGKTATKEWGGKFFKARTQEEYKVGVHTTITDAFRAYDSMQQCFMNYYELLNTKLYARVKAGVQYQTQMAQIKLCGYMTSSTEVNSVISIIQKYNLTAYDSDQPVPVVEELTGARTVTAYSLNVRCDANAASADVGTLYKGSDVLIDKVKDGWGHFEGWINLSYTRGGAT